MFLVSCCSCLCRIHWSQVLSRQWRCSWSSASRRCSNYIWVINNFIGYKGASYIRRLMLILFLQNNQFVMGLKCKHFIIYLVSPVSFLNANPNIATFLLATVLNKLSMIFAEKRRFWNSFISITWKYHRHHNTLYKWHFLTHRLRGKSSSSLEMIFSSAFLWLISRAYPEI